MSKSQKYKPMFDDDYEFDYEEEYSKKSRKDDRKMQIQQARRKAQAERDKAVADLLENSED